MMVLWLVRTVTCKSSTRGSSCQEVVHSLVVPLVVPDNCCDTVLCLATILVASFRMSFLYICRALFLVQASRTSPAKKPYLHLPLFLWTLSRYRIAYPRISLCLINLIGPLKCRYSPLLLIVLGVLFLHVRWYLCFLLFVIISCMTVLGLFAYFIICLY